MENFSVEQYARRYLEQHFYITCIQFSDSDEFCKKLLDTMVTVFLAANSGLDEAIKSSLQRERPKKVQQRVKTWKKRIRTACVAYCGAIYETLDTADVFIQAKTYWLDCNTAFTNKICFTESAEKARIKSEKLCGFEWFASKFVR